MNMDSLISQICEEIRQSAAEPDVMAIVTNVLVDEGVDIRREPSLPAMKSILVQAFRAADERRSMSC